MEDKEKTGDQLDNVAEIEKLKETVASQAKTIEDQQAKITDLETKLDEKMVEIIDQAAELKKLQAGKSGDFVKEKKPEPKKKVVMPEPIEFEGKKYRFRFAAFYYKATRYEAQDVAIKENLIAEILADKNQTLLAEVF